jgi:hypothetical protein
MSHRLHRHITGRGSTDYLTHYTDPLAIYPAEVAGNPFPLGVLGGLGGLGGLSGAGHVSGRRRKLASQRLTQALQGDKAARAEIHRLAALGWAGFPEAEMVLRGEEETAAEKVAAAKAEAAAVSGRAEARETRFLEAGTSIGSALATSFGRSRRQPARRKKRRRAPRYGY